MMDIQASTLNLPKGMKLSSPSGAPGRPRAFDIEKALETAMNLFWKQGYEGTSLSDLTEAMGINRPSLYAAFGNKESLFRKVVDRYGSGPGGHVSSALAEPTAKKVAEAMIRGSVKLLGNPDHPRGCLMVHGALACSQESSEIQQEMSAKRQAAEEGLRRRFEKAQQEGDLAPQANPADLARFVQAVTQGMAVLAADGASEEELERVGSMAMQAWPE